MLVEKLIRQIYLPLPVLLKEDEIDITYVAVNGRTVLTMLVTMLEPALAIGEETARDMTQRVFRGFQQTVLGISTILLRPTTRETMVCGLEQDGITS